MIGKWGAFLLQQELGRGATAKVYLAIRESTSERVALKIFHPAFWDEDKLRRRALSEFEAVSTLKHPSIVRVLEAVWDQDPPGVVLEFIDGTPLDKFQNRLPYILPEVAGLIMIDVLRALEHAHERGVIHRDLKPANIMVSTEGRVVVSDFGLAKMIDVSRYTLSGTLIGSPDYMSPEQARGDIATPQSDLFSAAAILYFLVTGTRPFTRHTPLATLAAVSAAEVEPAQKRNPKLSPALSRLIHKGLSREPKDRFASARDFREALEDYLATVGLASTAFQFPLWVAHSAEVSMDALKSVAEALALRCEKQISHREWDGGMETLSHLSLVAPDSAALSRLMQSYKQERQASQRKRFYIPAAAALLLLLVGAGYVGYGYVKKPVLPEVVAVTAPATVAVATPAPAPAPAAAPKPVRRQSDALQVPRVSAVAKKPTSLVRLTIPQDVRVYWDGHRIDQSKPFQAEVGMHLLKLGRPGHPPIEQAIAVLADEPTVIQVH